jgi:Flp pilus assembly protein TadG
LQDHELGVPRQPAFQRGTPFRAHRRPGASDHGQGSAPTGGLRSCGINMELAGGWLTKLRIKAFANSKRHICINACFQQPRTRMTGRTAILRQRIITSGCLLTRLRRNSDGAAAVEFALVALPFLALCGGVFQIAFQIWATQNFDRALQNAVRTIFTGQFQQANAGQTDPATLLANLKTTMCGPSNALIPTVFNCQGVKIDVATASNFASAAPAVPLDAATGTWKTNFGTNYACAKPGTIVVVTAAVQFPTFFNLMGLNTRKFTTGSGAGSSLLTSTAVFRTEPYQVVGASPC